MATAEYAATVGAVRASAAPANSVAATSANVAAAKSDGTDGAAFTGALATLVADGASPTQAHVTAVNSAWATYKADIDALTAAASGITSDVTLYVGSLANVSDMNKLREAVNQLLKQAAGSGLFPSGSGTPRSPNP